MKKIITTYFILFIYLLFSIGLIIENHNHCDSCDNGSCNIEFAEKNHQNDYHNNCHACETESHHLHNEEPCNCTINEYKITNNYINEKSITTASSIVISLFFINTFLNNETSNINLSDVLFYFKIPDKRLFSIFSIYELSSILR